MSLPGSGGLGAVPVGTIWQFRAAVGATDLHDAGDVAQEAARHFRGS